MNPVIVIPSYWNRGEDAVEFGDVCAYDHATPVLKPVPELEVCLDSLEDVRGILRVIVLLVAPADCEADARARVDGICRAHRDLNPLVIGSAEAEVIAGAVERCVPRLGGSAIALRGYGAIRNMGLAVASVLGHDVVVFLDDDQVVPNGDFLIDALYGLGMKTRQNLPILAKSGYFLDTDGSPYAPQGDLPLRDRFWSKRVSFNQWMHRALSTTRISRSNYVCGGCFALAGEAFTHVAFDPTITRGEDLDYLLNMRMMGYDVWFDNAWCVRHVPPDDSSHATRFLQDVYRWEYEIAKLGRANATIGMRQVRPESLRPYPADWLDGGNVRRRVLLTSLIRMLAGPERGRYASILFRRRHEAQGWAASVAGTYFELLTYWPQIMSFLWDNMLIARRVVNMGTPNDYGACVRPGAAHGPSTGLASSAVRWGGHRE